MKRRTLRWILLGLTTLVLVGAVWLSSRPRVLVPYFSRLVTHNLLRDQGEFRFQGFSGGLLSDLELTGVNLTVEGRDGALAIVGVDTLRLGYRLGELFQQPPRVREARLRGVQILARRGSPAPDADAAGSNGASSRAGAPFDLPGFSCDDLEILEAEFALSDQAGRRIQNVPMLNWRGSVRTGDELVLVSRDSDIWWETGGGRVENLTGVIRTDAAAVTFQRIGARINERDLTLSGRRLHSGPLLLEIAAEEISTPEVEDLLDLDLGFFAEGGVSMTLSAVRDTIHMEYGFDGRLEMYDIAEFTGVCDLVDDRLSWRHMQGRINGAGFSGTGDFDISDTGDVVMRLVGNISDVDLSAGLVPDTDLPRTGGWGRLELWRRFGAGETRVVGRLHEGFLDTVPFDSVDVHVVAVDRDSVVFERFDLFYGGAEARLTGVADSLGNFEGHLDLAVADLGDLPPQWNLPALRGSARASGGVAGLDPAYDFDGRVHLEQAGIGPLSIASADLRLSVADVLGEPLAMIVAEGEGLRAGDIDCGVFDLEGMVSSELAMLHGFRCANGDSSLSLRGQADFSTAPMGVYIPDLDLVLEGEAWRLEDVLRCRMSRDYVSIDPFRFSSEHGQVAADGVWDGEDGVLDGRVEVVDIDLAGLAPLLPALPPLNGRCSARFDLGGSPRDMILQGDLRLDGYIHDLARVDSLLVSGRFAEGAARIDSLDLFSDKGDLTLSGRVAAPDAAWRDWWREADLDLSLVLRDGDLDFMTPFALPALDRLSGRVDGTCRVTGRTSRPEFDGRLVSRPFHIHWLNLDEVNGTIAYSDGQLTLGDLDGRKADLVANGRIELPLRLDFLSVPESPPEGPLYMNFRIPDGTPLDALAEATNAFVGTGGRGGLDVVISGKAEHPYYSGTATVRDGDCVIRGLSEVYRDISADGSWQGDVLSVTDITGGEGARGAVRGEGEVIFEGLGLRGFDFRLAADRFLVASIPDLRVLIRSDEIALTGARVGPDSVVVPKFSGDLEVIKARYLGDFTEQPGVNDPLQATVAPDWLADLDINAPPRSGHIVNRTMELALGGQVRLVRDLEGMNLSGALDINQGRLPVFNNDFRVTEGDLDFSRDADVIPHVELRAETSVRLPAADGGNRRLERIYVDMTGSARAPQVSFSSESGYARNNIERMLLGLSPHATDTQATSVIRTETISAGFNILEREVAQELGVIDTFDIESGRERVDGTTQTLIGVGKFFGQGLYVKIAQAVTDQDREVLMEYQLSDNLLLQSEIRRHQDEFMGNTTYSVDLKFRQEY